MSASLPFGARRITAGKGLEVAGAWLLALLWIGPLLYAFWTAFHPSEYVTRFDLFAPLTLDNFREAWATAPFARYILNTFILVTVILAGQFVLCTLAGFAFARFEFAGREPAFFLRYYLHHAFPTPFARMHLDARRPVDLEIRIDAHGHRRGQRVDNVLVRARIPPDEQKRRLPRRDVPHRVRRGVELPDEGRHEPSDRKIRAQLVVHLRRERLERRAQSA